MQQSSDALYGEVVKSVLKITDKLMAARMDQPLTLAELADKLFALRECINRIEELRKQISKVEGTYEQAFIAVSLASSVSADKVKTAFVTAEAVPKLGLRVPRKDEPAYGALLTFLGVPEEVQRHGALTFYFPGLCDYYTALQAQGHGVPEELSSVVHEYEMSYVKTVKKQSMKGAIDVEES